MFNVSRGMKRVGKSAATLFAVLGFLAGPAQAAASTVLPSQVLPPTTGRSCTAVTFSDIQAHVYDANLDSFDITLSDSSYVAVATDVDGKPIGYNYITRWANPDGSIRMHVDLQALRMDRDVKVQIAFMGATRDESGNSVTCIFTVPATIPAVIHPAPISGGQGGTTSNLPGVKPGTTGNTSEGVATGSTSATSSRNPGMVAAMSSLGNLCADGGSSRLWVVLLVLFGLFVFTLSTQRFEPNSSVRDWNIGLILAVFIGLLIFWYISSACRAGAWAPAISTIITIVGLLYTMLKGDDTQEILLLKDGKK